jgi:hypothetical protein
MLRNAVLSAVLCAVLVSGCMAQGEVPPTEVQRTSAQPTAAPVGSVISQRGTVARQYRLSARVFQRARLGFRIRLDVAVGRFTACDTGGAGSQEGSADGEQYQIVAMWVPDGPPPAEQGGLLERAVPAIEGAIIRAGWSQFRRSASSGVDMMAARQGITLALDADPANPAPLERDWIPSETYTLAGPCVPVTAQAATGLSSEGEDIYGTARSSPPGW